MVRLNSNIKKKNTDIRQNVKLACTIDDFGSIKDTVLLLLFIYEVTRTISPRPKVVPLRNHVITSASLRRTLD